MKMAPNPNNECAICCKFFPKLDALTIHMAKHLTDYLQQDKTRPKELKSEPRFRYTVGR